MKILYILALLSFAALAWAAFAIARHIRKGAAKSTVEGHESDLSHALEARLNDIAKRTDDPTASARPTEEQNFSYFNRDDSGEIFPTKTTSPKDQAQHVTDRT